MRWDSAEFRDWMRQPTAWAILVVGVVLALFTWRSLGLEVEYAARSSFDTTVAEARNALDSRLRGYYIMLFGLQGLLQAGREVDRATFHRYTESLAAERDARQVRAFTYARRVPLALKKDYENAVRRDTSLTASGYPQFSIRPPGERGEYLVLHFIEPLVGNEAGF